MGVAVVAVFGIVWLLCMGLAIACIVAEWKLFKKAGKPGWGCLIPFYNMYLLCDIVWGNGLYMLLLFIPFGNFVFGLVTLVKLAKVFGKSGGFAAGIIFLSPIFMMILGFGKSEYQGPAKSGIRGAVIGSIVGCLLGFLLCIALAFVGVGLAQRGYVQSINKDTSVEQVEGVDTKNKTRGSEAEVPSLGDNLESVTLNNSEQEIVVNQIKDEYSYTDEGYSSASSHGVSLNVYYSNYPEITADTDLVEVLNDEFDMEVESLQSFEYYSNVSIDDTISGKDFVLRQVNYDLEYDGKTYSCFRIIKVDNAAGFPLITKVEVDNSVADAETEPLFREICDAYGIQFGFN